MPPGPSDFRPGDLDNNVLRKILEKIRDLNTLISGQGPPIIGPVITLSPSDVEIGAVEIKDHTTDDRVHVTNAAPVAGDFGMVVRNIPSGTQDVNFSTWLGSADPTVGQKIMAKSIPVVIASDQSAINVNATFTGGTVDQGVGGVSPWLVHVDNASFAVTQSTSPWVVSGTVAVTQSTSPWVVSSTQLPGALVGGRLDTNIGAWLGSTAPTVGQKTMANSIPVVLSSDQTSFTVAVTQSTSPWVVSGNITNAGTFAVQDSQVLTDNGAFVDGTSKLFMSGFIFDEVAGTALTENDAAAARIDSKRAVIHVIEDATTRGQRATVSAAGALKVDGSAVTQPVSGTVAVTQSTSPWVVSSTQLPAALVGGRLDTNLGAWLGSTAPTVGQKTMANSVPVVISSDQSSFTVAVTQSTSPWVVSSTQLPAALVGGRLDENVGAWLGSTAPTVGQKTMANSLPVTFASDQTTLTISGAVTNAGTFAVQDSQVLTDNGAFVDGTSKLFMSGFIFDEVAGTALTENDAAAARIDSKRAVVGVIEDFSTRGQRASVTAANALKVDGSAVAQPVTDNAGSLTIDTPQLPGALVGGRLDTNIGAWLGSTAPTVGQKTMANSVPVVLSSDQASFTVAVTQSTSPWVVSTTQLPGALVGGRLDTNIGAWLGSTAPTVGQKTMANSIPVVISSDQSSFTLAVTQSTSPWVVSTTQLPGALVGARLDTNIGSWMGSTAPTVGSKTSANSIPVVIANDQVAVPITAVNVGSLSWVDHQLFTEGLPLNSTLGTGSAMLVIGGFVDENFIPAPALDFHTDTLSAGTTAAMRLTRWRAVHTNLRDSVGNAIAESPLATDANQQTMLVLMQHISDTLEIISAKLG